MTAELACYRDEGCQAYPSCLNCPFPRCLFEEPGGGRRRLREDRDREINRLFQHGETVGAIAHRFKVSERTVYRILRKGGHPGLPQRSRQWPS